MMNTLSSACLAVLLTLAPAAFAAAPKKGAKPEQQPKPVRVVMQTDKGEIELELDEARAPKTVKNFLAYVDAGLYDGGVFHRTVKVKPDNQPNNTVKIEVIQGGINPARESEQRSPIPLERTNETGIQHKDGTISMARDTPDSAISDFFICIGDQPALDHGGRRNPDGQGFGAFGKVVRGMDVVRTIQQAPASGQQITPPVKILRATRKP